MSGAPTQKRAGRPPTPADRHAVPVRLERRHVRILDSIIRANVARDFAAGLTAAEGTAAATLSAGDTHHVERRVHLATERRQLLGLILEWYEAVRVAPTVKILVPDDTDDPDVRKKVAAWVAREEERLTATAPATVRIGLAKRELRRMEREEPEALERVLRAGRAATTRGTAGGEFD